MGKKKVRELLELISFLQDLGQIWMAQILFVYLLDRLIRQGSLKRSQLTVYYVDHLEQGCLIVIRLTGYYPKSLSMHLLSKNFREQLERYWERDFPVSRYEPCNPRVASPELVPEIYTALRSMPRKNLEEIVQRAPTYFRTDIQDAGFAQALARFNEAMC